MIRVQLRVVPVNHRLVLSNPALVSAHFKKSFSSVSCPTLAQLGHGPVLAQRGKRHAGLEFGAVRAPYFVQGHTQQFKKRRSFHLSSCPVSSDHFLGQQSTQQI